jgi:hypothetical protein
MKTTILAILTAAAALLTTAPVHADTLATIPNQAGGKIHLTDNTADTCAKGYLAAYSTSSDVNVNVMRGCWRVIDDSAHILWSNGNERMFPLAVFELTPYGQQRTNNTTTTSKGSM